MFRFVPESNPISESDCIATEGIVSDASMYIWTKIKELCTKLTTMFSELWNKMFHKRQQMVSNLETFKSHLSKVSPEELKKKLTQSVNPSSEEDFNPSGRGCFIVPKNEMLRVLADIDKATAYINGFGEKFISTIKSLNPSAKILTANETELAEIEAKMNELMDEQRVREKIAADFEAACPSLRMNLNNTFVVTQDTIQVLWKTPPNKGDGTYEELGYHTEDDVKQVCDVFIASVKKGYNNRDKKYIDVLYTIKDEVQKQESSGSVNDPLRQNRSALYTKIVNWLMMLKKMTIILDKEQLSLIENCYGSLSRLTVNIPSTWKL